MARLRFTIGTRYLYNDHVYQVVQLLMNNLLLVENRSFGGQFTISYLELVHYWSNGLLKFEIPSTLAKQTPRNHFATEYTYADFSSIPENLREEAWRRYQILLPLLKGEENERTRLAIRSYAKTLVTDNTSRLSKRQAFGSATSAPSIERWLRCFEESYYDIRALVPKVHLSARKDEKRLPQELETVIEQVLKECSVQRHYRTIDSIYALVVNRVAELNRISSAQEQLHLVSYSTLVRRINDFDTSILRHRRSRIAEKAEKATGESTKPTRILERVEIDHTLLDLLVVDENDMMIIGRPTIAVAIDVYSGMPLGFYVGFEPPSYRTVAGCLYHVILPKPDVCTLYETKHSWDVYGLPETLIIDGARENIGRSLEDACGLLGIILERMPIKHSWYKAAIERFFGTQNTGLIHMLHGTTFSNAVVRGDYDSETSACIALSIKLLHIFFLDIYAQTYNETQNMIPAQSWHESIQNGFIPALYTSAEEVRIALMSSEERTIQRQGIEFECLYYTSPDLAKLRSLLPKDKRVVKIKIDPSDISAMYVNNPLTNTFLRIPATNQAYTHNLSLWKHRVIRRFVYAEQKNVDIVALAAAKKKIQDIVSNEYLKAKSKRGRKHAARLLDVERRSKDQVNSDTKELPVGSSQHHAPLLPTESVDDTIDLSGWGGGYTNLGTKG